MCFGPPECGSGSFFHQEKVVRKPLFLVFCGFLFDFLTLKNYVNVPSKSNKQKIFFLKMAVAVAWIRGSVSGDPDPYQNVMDPQH
jgi:hypothetical protein